MLTTFINVIGTNIEYNNFSVRRLQFLVQADPDGPDLDPDTPPQKYYTVMIERIPGHLRSAAALREFFERIFPGDVYTIEIALDLKELDALNAKRKRVSHYTYMLHTLLAEWMDGDSYEHLSVDRSPSYVIMRSVRVH